MWSEQILHAAAEVIREAIAEGQYSVRIEMREADPTNGIRTNPRSRPDFVEQASLIHIQVRVVAYRHDLIRGNVVGAERGGLPVPHEFGKQVRHKACTGVEPPVERAVDRQVVYVRRVNGDVPTETTPQK